MKVLCFGSLNLDHTYQVERFLKPGETRSASGYEIHAGGKGLNQAIALARAGAEVHMAGCVGPDGGWLLELLRSEGVRTQWVEEAAFPTGHAVIQVDGSGQNCILICAGANAAVSPEQAGRTLEHFSAGDVLLLQNEISENDCIARQAKARGMELWLNPSPVTAELLEGDAVKLADWLVLNELELAALTGTEDTAQGVSQFMERSPEKKLVLTLGREGSLFAGNGVLLRQAAFPVTAVDTTGAGDTYLGYFLASFLETGSPSAALKRAAKAAALAVTRSGAAEAIPRAEELF
ncbi:MAG: ribokinase [Oscillibacter sp.]|nr:ribokinase [Oscillibacter sp.]